MSFFHGKVSTGAIDPSDWTINVTSRVSSFLFHIKIESQDRGSQRSFLGSHSPAPNFFDSNFASSVTETGSQICLGIDNVKNLSPRKSIQKFVSFIQLILGKFEL
jgi:hypothetical protein